MNKPHKHAELIKAWADGAEIEMYQGGYSWKYVSSPTWNIGTTYRIKPQEPKPDNVKSFYAHGNYHFQGMHISVRNDEEHNLILTFDGETGKLKSAEVLK